MEEFKREAAENADKVAPKDRNKRINEATKKRKKMMLELKK